MKPDPDSGAPSAAGDARCPRCGGRFHCGMNDAGPCACSTLKLDDALLAALRQRWQGCLCLDCLRELAADPSRVSCAPCTPASSA